MNKSIAHQPKTGALMAYDEDVLSARGRARVERHLAACEECRRSLSALRTYSKLMVEARETTPPPIDWSKMDLELRREARAQAAINRGGSARSAGRVRVAILGLAAAAAIGLAFWFGSRGNPSEVAHPVEPLAGDEAPMVPSPPEEQVPEATPPVIAQVTAVVGDVTDQSGAAVNIGTQIEMSDRLVVAERGNVHVRLREGTGIVIASASEVNFARFDAANVELELVRGSVSSQVSSLATGETYIVRAGDFSIHVRGTRFEVARNGDAVALSLDEGHIEVRDGDELISSLAAPAQWASSSDLEAPLLGAVRPAHGLTGDPSTWGVLTLPPLDYVEYWEIEGTPLGAFAEARLVAPQGELVVVGHGPDGSLYQSTVTMVAEGVTLSEEALRPERPEQREGYLSPDDVQPVLQRGAVGMRRCYDRVLRNHPEVQGELTVRLHVSPQGRVRRLEVRSRGPQPPEEFTTCLLGVTEQWEFPPPVGGGPVTLQFPLVLSVPGSAPPPE